MACPYAYAVMHRYLSQPGQSSDPASASHNIKASVLACSHRFNQVVQKVDLTSGDYTVTTIAGTVGTSGFSDGKACSPALPTGTPDYTLLIKSIHGRLC
jgi:hypothetical protein